MLKKLIGAAAGAGLVLSLAGAALAYGGHHRDRGGVDIDQDGRLIQEVDQRATGGGRHSDVLQRAELYAEQNSAYVDVDCGCRRTNVDIDQDGFLKQEVDQTVGGSSHHRHHGGSSDGDVTQRAFVTGFQNYAEVGGTD